MTGHGHRIDIAIRDRQPCFSLGDQEARGGGLTDSTAEKQTRKVVFRTDLLQEVLRRDFQQDIEDEEGSLRCRDVDTRLCKSVYERRTKPHCTP
jgi:hypothetical protein